MKAKSKRGHILVVEDDPGIREILRLTLEFEFYDVKCVANGQEALNALKEGPLPSLILLDLMMPIMNGWQFAEALSGHEAYKEIPVLVVSAYNPEQVKARAFVEKPIEVQTLLNFVALHNHLQK